MGQLPILVKKNFLIKKENPYEVILEFTFPIIIFILTTLMPDKSDGNRLLCYYHIPFSSICSGRFILYQMVLEKENGIRQSLQIMGMNNLVYGLSFLLT